MSTTVTVKDTTPSGESLGERMLEFLTERVTVRELIRSRVYQEVKDYNAELGRTFRGLVRPQDAVHQGNGFRFDTPRRVDWEKQFKAALQAFQEGRILLLVEQGQVDSLEQELVLSPSSEVTFLKLLPLVGG